MYLILHFSEPLHHNEAPELEITSKFYLNTFIIFWNYSKPCIRKIKCNKARRIWTEGNWICFCFIYWWRFSKITVQCEGR